MFQTGHSGFWQSIRDLPGRMPLRVKLITVLLALMAIALGVISVAGIAILRNDLIGPIDDSLTQQFNTAVGDVANYQRTGLQIGRQDIALDWITNKGAVQQVVVPLAGYSGGIGGHNPLGPPQQIPGPKLDTSQAWLSANSGHIITLPAASGHDRWRVDIVSGSLPDGSAGTLVLAINATSAYTTISQLAAIDVLASLAVIVLLAIVGVAVVRRSLRPLTEIEQTAGAIAAGDLSRRVPERDPGTEVGRLGRSLNVMLSQIESAFHARSRSEAAARRSEEKMRQFVGDASHELRTPLTAIRGFAEYYRQRGGIDTGGAGAGKLAPADLDRIMRRVEQEASRMGILVEDMLLLARLDQQRPLEARPVDLLSLAADAVHDARVVAPDRSINLTVGSGAALLVIGDEVRLRQVIGNLMSNALSHTPDGSPIDVLIRSGNLDEAPVVMTPPPPPEPGVSGDEFADLPSGQFSIGAAAADEAAIAGEAEIPGGELAAEAAEQAELPARTHRLASQPAAVLEVADHGPGLTRDQGEHVFERFYRADQARTSGGTGLGLAIVAALVAAHGGATWVRSQPGQGATFSIALPLSPEAVQGSDDDFADADDIHEGIHAEHEADWIGSATDEQHARATAAPGNEIVLSSARADGQAASTRRAASSAASR
jgi:two-component system, OmpR family, sensor kinase